MAAAVPFAIKGGAALAGHFLGKKLAGPSKGQQAAVAGTDAAANRLANTSGSLLQQGSALTGRGSDYLSQAGNYYGNILNSRRSARESLAPEMSTALDFYRGAESKAKRTLRGGSRDYALAELDRQKTGQLAAMLPAARRTAAEGISDIGSTSLFGGTSLSGQGAQAAGTEGYLRSGMFNDATALRDQEKAGGSSVGSFIYDILQATPLGKIGKGGGGGMDFSKVPSLFQGF